MEQKERPNNQKGLERKLQIWKAKRCNIMKKLGIEGKNPEK